jgi:hypothetical protein
LALTAVEQGDLAQAELRLAESLAAVRQLGRTFLTVRWLLASARHAQICGELARAARLSGVVETHSATLTPSTRLGALERRALARMIEALQQQLEPARFAAVWAEGKHMTLDEALALNQETG